MRQVPSAHVRLYLLGTGPSLRVQLSAGFAFSPLALGALLICTSLGRVKIDRNGSQLKSAQDNDATANVQSQ